MCFTGWLHALNLLCGVCKWIFHFGHCPLSLELQFSSLFISYSLSRVAGFAPSILPTGSASLPATSLTAGFISSGFFFYFTFQLCAATLCFIGNLHWMLDLGGIYGFEYLDFVVLLLKHGILSGNSSVNHSWLALARDPFSLSAQCRGSLLRSCSLDARNH